MARIGGKPPEYWEWLDRRIEDVLAREYDNSLATVDGKTKFIGSSGCHLSGVGRLRRQVMEKGDAFDHFEVRDDNGGIWVYLWSKGFLQAMPRKEPKHPWLWAISRPLRFVLGAVFGWVYLKVTGSCTVEEAVVRTLQRFNGKPNTGQADMICAMFGDTTSPALSSFPYDPSLALVDYLAKTGLPDPSTPYFAFYGNPEAMSIMEGQRGLLGLHQGHL